MKICKNLDIAVFFMYNIKSQSISKYTNCALHTKKR